MLSILFYPPLLSIMFQRKKLRPEIQKNGDKSSVKHFIQDQMGVLLTIVGGVPIFFEYFGLINPPNTIPSAALKAISITSLLICTIVILFIYSERRQFVRERKIYTAALGLLFMIGGLVFLVIYTYEPLSDQLLAKLGSESNYEVYLYHLNSADITAVQNAPLAITSNWFALALLGGIIWASLVVLLILKIDSLIKKVNFTPPQRHFSGEDDERVFGTWLKPVKKIWLPVARIMLIVYMIVIFIVLFEPLVSKYSLFETITISVRKINFIRTLAFVSYYPFLVIGAMLMITVVFNSFEKQRNFYENINELSDPFFDEVDKITDNLNHFERWFNERELESRERFLSNDRKPASDAKDVQTSRLDALEVQRIFYWRAMREQLEYYRERIEEFATPGGRQLLVSGPLIDKILKNCFPRVDGVVKEFKAVSSGDLAFWRRRGEEYLSWNRDMIRDGLHVSRIFVLNYNSPFDDFVDEELKGNMTVEEIDAKFDARQLNVSSRTEENIRVLFKQVACGIRVYICFDRDLKTYDGTKFGLNRQDFGVYPNFAVTFFGKPLRIGGRTLLMSFDQEIITDFDDHYESILKKIQNVDCKLLDDELAKVDEDDRRTETMKFVEDTEKRLNALQAFLLNEFGDIREAITSARRGVKIDTKPRTEPNLTRAS